jgi:hypothetical protein
MKIIFWSVVDFSEIIIPYYFNNSFQGNVNTLDPPDAKEPVKKYKPGDIKVKKVA